ncbi:MAG: amidohydrolase family protein [Acidobacteriia bacterium]|nr:amidohydrolase family protein [Terriglobia bacterium]
MRFFPPRPITFLQAHGYGPGGTILSSLRVAEGRVAGLNCAPEPKDTVIKLGDALVLPGLINAHDHLELNNFPRMKWRDQYANARDWIADFQPHFETDPTLSAAMSIPLKDRLLLGAVKNLLSGVTTVCHHNPLYRQLRRGFPVRVVRRYRFSHSLLIDGEAVKRECRRTPEDWPWIIHASEGTDVAAAGEFSQLDRWDCVGPNTLIVHGVGLGKREQATLIHRGGALIWCPSSNDFLLGATADVSAFTDARRVALGTDSRLSGERDLLTEMNYAATHHYVSAADLLRMVTVDAATLLKLSDAGALRLGVPADLIVIPLTSSVPLDTILASDRSKIRLIMLGGRAQVGDVDMSPVFAATRVPWVEARIDGQAKLMARALANRMKDCAAHEPGLEL